MLKIAGVDYKSGKADIGRADYVFADLPDTLPGFGKTPVQAKARVKGAVKDIVERVAKHRPCNAYFKSLPRGQTLADIIAGQNLLIGWLCPRKGGSAIELTVNPKDVAAGKVAVEWAYRAGVYIALSQWPIALGWEYVAATLVHEFAHVAGAPGLAADANPADPKIQSSRKPDYHAAERALVHCLYKAHFKPTTVGAVEGFMARRFRYA